MLGKVPGLAAAACSKVYLTEPQGLKMQPWFYNQTVKLLVEPVIGPLDLMRELREIEERMGRKRNGEERFGPRVIDLDLLLFGDVVLNTPELTLPHPRMKERAFVLIPLREIAPDLVFPDGGTLAEAIGRLRFSMDKNTIRQ